MSRNFFNYGTKFTMDGKEHIVVNKEQQNVVVELIDYRQKKSCTLNELLVAFDEERLVFKDPNNRFPTVRSSFSDEEVEPLKIKLDVLDPVIKGYFKTINLDNYLKELEVEKGIKVSRASFYNWKRTWEQYGDARFLLNEKSGPRKRRYEEEVLDSLKRIMDENLYNGTDMPYKWIYREYKKSIKAANELRDINDQIIIRSFQTIWRIIKEKRDFYKQQKAREGYVAAKLQKDGAKSVAEKPTRPLERVEIDWTPTDLLLVDPHTLKRKTAWLIYAIDVFSGNPLGFYITFDHPDSFAVKQCLLHCFLPKVYLKKLYPDVANEWTAYGIPTEVVIDNARINDSYELERVFQFFGITPIYPEVAAGHKKGTVERGQKTFNDIVHTLKGTTFSNIFEKKQYDSDGEACITLQAFYYIAHFIFVDIISHNLSHSRIGGTPHQIWESGISEHPDLLALPFSKRDIRITLCGGSERRKIQSKGILLSRGWYQSAELMALRTKMKQESNEDADVVVRFDYTDVRKVFVENPNDFSFIDVELDPNTIRDYQKHFDVVPDLPIPFQQIKAISLKLGRDITDFDDVPITEAIAKIRAIEESQDKDKKKGYKETIAQEASIIEVLAKGGATLEDLTPLNEADSFAFVGDVSEAKQKQSGESKQPKGSKGSKDASTSKNPKNERGKGLLNTADQNVAKDNDINCSKIGNNISEFIDDDLPDYNVSYMRRI